MYARKAPGTIFTFSENYGHCPVLRDFLPHYSDLRNEMYINDFADRTRPVIS